MTLLLLIEPFSWTAFFLSLAFSAASYAVQRIFGPKPPKVTKGQMSGELWIQNAEEGVPVAEIYGGAPGVNIQAALWTNHVNAVTNSDGNLEKNAGLDECYTDASGTGDAGAWTVQTIDSGDFELRWTFRASDSGPSGRSFLGLTNGSFSIDFTAWDYCMHVSTEENISGTPHPANSVFVYEGAPPNKAYLDGVWEEGDTLRITCQSGVVKYWYKDQLMYTSPTAPSYPMRVVASLACLDSTVEDLTISTPSEDLRGGIKTAGTIIWAKAPRKVVTTEKQGGKGAPKQTVETVTYYTDLAILFGRGRLRLKKLWANADLIVNLDAGAGQATGLVDSGTGGGGDYTQDAPPETSSAGVDLFWGLRLSSSAVGTISGSVGAGGGAAMRWYEGNYEQLPDALIEADVGADTVPAYRGWAYLVIENFNLSKYGGIPTFTATVENIDLTELGEIAEHLADRVGIEPGDRDFSVFDGEQVRGLIVNQVQSPRQTLEMASLPYRAEFYEAVDGELTGVYLGGASAATVDNDHLGMAEGDAVSTAGEMGNLAEHSIVDEIQIPRQVSVTAFDPGKDHELSTQHAYLMNGAGSGIEATSLQMALLPDEIRQTAERLIYQRHIERESIGLKLPWEYGYLNPSDIVTLTLNGITTRLRIGSITGAMPGLLEVRAVADQLEVYSQSIAGASGSGYVAPTVSSPVRSIALLIDSVMLRDQDNEAGYYAAIVPAADGAWGGAVLYRDRGAGYEVAGRFPAPATAGVTTGSVTSGADNTIDTVTTITVDLYGTTATLESVTELEMLNGANAACLGDGMIFQFQTAVQVGGYDNRWTLSNILWARRGSDYAATTHAAGSRFVLLDAAVQFIQNDLSERGISRSFKAVTAGFSVTDAAATVFTWDARTLKPLSVVEVTGSRDGGNNLTINWKRRSRLGSAWLDYVDAPLGEDSEAYEIDIMSGATVLRTIAATSETASYTAAEQTTDGLTPGDLVEVNIYQISALAGRGFVRNATI